MPRKAVHNSPALAKRNRRGLSKTGWAAGLTLTHGWLLAWDVKQHRRAEEPDVAGEHFFEEIKVGVTDFHERRPSW
ncbi:hypothetical protein ADK75_06395 [Streptomyces virginiae]|uniref:Uncharacterized protein n=1 Tax=Streptomyces virginiae TaxID=1961 RepID=A0A0L8N2U2_STRVG|nr:hypothetical protein [Streptomyces virginiae]KOG56855.1 hypothetical protein ADK75_06395 [Streptomyces virginiae]